MKPFDIMKPISFRTFEEDEYAYSGYATPKGNEDLANEMAFLYIRGGFKRAEQLRKRYNLWPHIVPSLMITIAFDSLANGRDYFFNVIFVENDTKIRFDRLESAIITADERHKWLYWEDAFDNLKLDYEEDELVNPKIFLNILKPDAEAKKRYWEARERGEMPNEHRIMW